MILSQKKSFSKDIKEENDNLENVESENKIKQESAENCIKEEVQLIMNIFPKIPIETVQKMLKDAENQPNRFKTVIRELSTKDKFEEISSLPQKADVNNESTSLETTSIQLSSNTTEMKNSLNMKDSPPETVRNGETLLLNSDDDDDDNLNEILTPWKNRLQTTPHKTLSKTGEMKRSSCLDIEESPAKKFEGSQTTSIQLSSNTTEMKNSSNMKDSSAATFRKGETLLLNSDDDDDDNLNEILTSWKNRLQTTPDKTLSNTSELKRSDCLNVEKSPPKKFKSLQTTSIQLSSNTTEMKNSSNMKDSSAETFGNGETLLLNSDDDDDDNLNETLTSWMNRLKTTPDKLLSNTGGLKRSSCLDVEDSPAKKFKSNNKALSLDDENTSTSNYFTSKSQFTTMSFYENATQMKRILPNADPDYLKMQVIRLENKPAALNLFVQEALKKHDYPRKKAPRKIFKPQSSNSQNSTNSFVGIAKRAADLENQIAKKKRNRFKDEIDLDDLFNRKPSDHPAPPTQFSRTNIREVSQTNSSRKLDKGLNEVPESVPKRKSDSNSLSPKASDDSDQLDSFEERQEQNRTSNSAELSVFLKNEIIQFYTTKFNVKNFLEVIPDPENYFRENRHLKPWSAGCEQYATCALFNIYNKIGLDKIKECVFIAPNFLAACRMLDEVTQQEEKPRPNFPMPPLVENDLPLLKEIAYKMHYDGILKFIKTQQKDFRLKIAKAKEDGLIQTCNCCYNEEVLPEDMFKCEANCWFCKECIKTSVEMSFQDGRVTFECLGNCQAQYSLDTLEQALPGQLFLKVGIQNQTEEIQNFQYDCPFCDFAAEFEAESEIFCCLNPVCMKESCRLCKGQSHIPYRCDEVEQSDNVMARTYVEDKMSKAIIRECGQCKVKFVKSFGCNTIVCPCGVQMCYICGKTMTDLFLHRGCQRYSVAKIDEERVMKAAREAKKEVSGILKSDPSADIRIYFEELRKSNFELKQSNVLKKTKKVLPKKQQKEKNAATSLVGSLPRRSKRLARL